MTLLNYISKVTGLPFSSIKLFPETSEVFSKDIELISDVLFPICSIDLSFVNAKWKGKIYMLQFNEDPYKEDNKKYFNQYCKHSAIGFRIVDSKYEFLTDLKYFDVSDDWKEWKDLTKRTYLDAKKMYREKRKKFWINFIIPGGKPEWKQEDETPNDPDGNPMTFVAQYDTGQLCKDNCEKEIYLFYSDNHKLAVQIYQIS